MAASRKSPKAADAKSGNVVALDPIAEALDKAAPPPLDPQAPLPSAKAFVAKRYTISGLRTLHFYQGEFYAWDGAAYERIDDEAVRAQLWAFLDSATCLNGKGEPEPFNPNTVKVNNVLDALRGVADPRSVNGDEKFKTKSLPVWLEAVPGMNMLAAEYVVTRGRVLHLPTKTEYPTTPALFTTTAFPVAYDSKAKADEWNKFVGQLWPDDPKSIDTLQEIFGYLLTADTRQQKMFLVVGPKRSGKGTISRVLREMLGPDNVAAPTLAAMTSNFGLTPLIGKMAAIISDARLSGRADKQIIAERLLSISGEDAVTIDRKYLSAWTGRLPTRFLIFTNELPEIGDASGALSSRFIILKIEESFYEREDHGLTDRLLKELPGILNWAIEGYHRLRKRGHFVQPASAADMVEELDDLGSPISAFVKDACSVGHQESVEAGELYKAWEIYCEQQGRKHAGNAASFGRLLKAAYPSIRVERRKEDGKNLRVYRGIGLPM